MDELDDILSLLENPTRRRILRRLTLETHYPLQLAKELKVSPQAVMKHLSIMEKHGLVKCFREDSTMGPRRKCYFTTKRLSLRLDMGPNLFEARLNEFSNDAEKRRSADEPDGDPEDLVKLRDELREINEKISSIDGVMLDLIDSKERRLDRANRIIQQLFDEYEDREILHYILNHTDFTLRDLSENLGLREEFIRNVLKRFSRIGIIPEEEF